MRHDLEFERVTFRHGDRTVIDDASLSVPEGQRIAVVGPSGAGRSSLLQLLARYYDVDAGAVRVGGVDVRAIDTEVLMAQMVAHRMRTVRRADAPWRPLRRFLEYLPRPGAGRMNRGFRSYSIGTVMFLLRISTRSTLPSMRNASLTGVFVTTWATCPRGACSTSSR
ncbi:ATP-binding cassette domain-containing protein [Streptomyces sp. NPDC001584]|uniref:ATP-binding cassette domain-containing protein n=1 Tax=Streptomyces sp. NPDC001584 TaxID=3154521 RepID=UPI0033196C28